MADFMHLWRPLCAIVVKELRQRLRSPLTIGLTLGAPLALALIMPLALVDLLVNTNAPLRAIPIGIVDSDRGAWGSVVTAAFDSNETTAQAYADERFRTLFAVTYFADAAGARAAVERGDIVGALIIPPAFSSGMERSGARLTLYLATAARIRSLILRDAVQAVADRLAVSKTALLTTAQAVVQDARLRSRLFSGQLDRRFAEVASAAADPAANPVQVVRIATPGVAQPLNLARHFTFGLSILFVAFAALAAAAGIGQELQQRTWQRMLLTPAPAWLIVVGVALGIFVTTLLQMGIFVAVTGALAVWLSAGQGTIWGSAWVNIFVMTVALVAGITGTALFLAGLLRDQQQVVYYGGSLLIVMALVGGAVIPVAAYPAPVTALARFTFFYWGMDGYMRLAQGENLAVVAPHLLILGVLTLVTGWGACRCFTHRKLFGA